MLDPPEELESGYFRQAAGWYPGITTTELLDSVRGWWAASPRTCTRLGVRHAVAVAEGATRGIYEITQWVAPRHDGDYGFSATPIESGPLWETYVGPLGRKVPFSKGARNPIKYWPQRG